MEKIINHKTFNEKNRRMVFRDENKQVLVIQVGSKIFALDNRCPHEGYPLSEGNIDDDSCSLTCNWHNWKFDLKSGKCFLGGDNVRTYPIRKDEQNIYVNLSDPTPEEIKASVLEGMEVAFRKRQYARISREIARLHYNEIDALESVKAALIWSAENFEFGTTHAYAALADWINLYQNTNDLTEKIIALTEGIDHLALDSLRHDQYPFVKNKVTFDAKQLENAVENEDRELCESMINSFFENGGEFKELEYCLSKIALAHYNDFGHSLIYVVKSFEISRVFSDREIDRILALNLIRSLCYTTREDLLPQFKNYQSTLEKIKSGDFKESEKQPLSNLSVTKSYNWLVEQYKNYEIKELYDHVIAFNAKNMLQYDLSFQEATNNPVTKNIGWLDYTHALTFSNAVRITCEKYEDLWPAGLAQMLSFYGRNTPFIDKSIKQEDWDMSVEAFKEKFNNLIFDHGLSQPIFSAHVLKTTIAVLEEVEYATEDTKKILLASINRFVSSPIKQKHMKRLVSQGLKLVEKDFK